MGRSAPDLPGLHDPTPLPEAAGPHRPPLDQPGRVDPRPEPAGVRRHEADPTWPSPCLLSPTAADVRPVRFGPSAPARSRLAFRRRPKDGGSRIVRSDLLRSARRADRLELGGARLGHGTPPWRTPPAGFPVSRPLSSAKPATKTPPGSTTCAAYPTKPDLSPCPDQPTPPASDDRTERFEASRPAEVGSPLAADRRTAAVGSEIRPAWAEPAAGWDTHCTPRAPPSVPIARTDPRSSCTRPLPPDGPPITAAKPSFRRHVRSHCTASLAFHRHCPHRRRRPLTPQRNGSAHPPLPKSACLSASCRANAPARPDRRVRPCSPGSTSIPAPGATRSCRTRSTSPPLDLAGAAAWARTPGRSPGPARLEPPTTREGLRSDCTDPGPTAQPDPSPCPPHGSRPDDSAHDRASDGLQPLRPIDSGRSFRPGLSVSGTRPKAPWRSDRLASRSRRRWGSPASTTGHRRRSDGPGGLPRLAFQPAGGGGVPSRSAPVPAAAAGVCAIGKLDLAERRVGGSCLDRPLRLVFPSVALPHPALAATSVTTARPPSPVRR